MPIPMTDPLITTIDPKQLTLADWLAIASSRGNAKTWGFYGWLETVDPSVLGGLTRSDIEAIAYKLDLSVAYVMSKIADNL
jgi:hypothetical protein